MVANVLSEGAALINVLIVRKENVKQCTITVRIFFVKEFMVRQSNFISGNVKFCNK